MASSKHHHPIVYPSIALILILGYCAPGLAVEFAGGKGTAGDPYQVATAEQLIAIGTQPGLSTKYYVLVADIDLSGRVWSSPVIPSFAGDFDGNGLTIRNLRIKGYGSQGLFGLIVGGALVKNLGMEDVDVIGTGSSGALAGQNIGEVLNCYATGVLTCAGPYAGGLVGYNSYGTISNSYSTVEVTGYSGVGGLVGTNKGSVSNCHSAGAILGYSAVGGLAGSNAGEITSCFSSSDVTGGGDIGGLVGNNNLYRIAFCYSTGHVIAAGTSNVGGLVGSNDGYIVACYSVATIEGQGTRPEGAKVGGLVGVTSGGSASMVKDCYFLASSDGGGPDNQIATGLTLAAMKLPSSYAWGFWGPDADNLDNPWFMPADALPVQTWQTEITGLVMLPYLAGLSLDQAKAALTATGFILGNVSYDFCRALPRDSVIYADPHSVAPAGGVVNLVLSLGGAYDWAGNPGDGTPANPYQVQTAGQLESLADHPELWDKCFMLTADVDMAGRTYPAPLIAPDTDHSAGFQGTAFTGTFDGQGHSIRNLTISVGIHDYVGLFGVIGKAGRIDNLHLLDVSVAGTGSQSYVGALAGYNEGTLTDCLATGTVITACTSSEGLVGFNRGTMTNSSADVAIIRGSCHGR